MTAFPNLRDLAGACRADRRVLRPHRLLRSATLASVAPVSATELTARSGAGTYVDLRTDPEVERDGAPVAMLSAGWAWHRVPLRDKAPGVPGDTPADVLCRYRLALPRYLEAAAEVGRLLGDRPVLVSCSLGKDRTGLVVALVLAWLSVERAHILADFAESNNQFPAALGLLPPRWRDPAVPISRVAPEVCATVLASLGETAYPPPAAAMVDRLFTEVTPDAEVARPRG